MRSRTVRSVAAVISVGAMLAAVACGGSDEEGGSTDEPIQIGFATAQSGFIEPFDAPAVVAAELAKDDINEEGGVDGRPLEFTYADTKSDLDQGANAATKLIDDGADFLVVSCDFDYGAAAAGVAESRGMVVFSLCAGSPKFGVDGIGEHAYTMGSGTPTDGAIGAQFALEEGWENAFVILDSTLDYSVQYVDFFKEHYEAGGGTVVGEDTYSADDPSFASQIQRIRSTRPQPDVIVLASTMPGGASAVKQIREAGIDLPLLSNAGADGDYWLEAVPNLSNWFNTAYSSIHGDDPNATVNELVERYESTTGDELATGSFINGYSVIEALELAVERAGTTDSEAVKEELDSFEEELLVGATTFTPEAHMPIGRPMRIIEIDDGKATFREVYSPTDVGF